MKKFFSDACGYLNSQKPARGAGIADEFVFGFFTEFEPQPFILREPELPAGGDSDPRRRFVATVGAPQVDAATHHQRQTAPVAGRGETSSLEVSSFSRLGRWSLRSKREFLHCDPLFLGSRGWTWKVGGSARGSCCWFFTVNFCRKKITVGKKLQWIQNWRFRDGSPLF